MIRRFWGAGCRTLVRIDLQVYGWKKQEAGGEWKTLKFQPFIVAVVDTIQTAIDCHIRT